MADVHDIKLVIDRVPNTDDQFKARITYSIRFPYWEEQAWIKETITLAMRVQRTLVSVASLEAEPIQLIRPTKDKPPADGTHFAIARTPPVVALTADQIDASDSTDRTVIDSPKDGWIDEFAEDGVLGAYVEISVLGPEPSVAVSGTVNPQDDSS